MSPAVLSSKRIREVWMVKDVEEFGAELSSEAPPHLKFFANEKSMFLNPVSRKILRPIVPSVPSGGETRDRTARGIAAERREGIARIPHCSAIQHQRSCTTRSITRIVRIATAERTGCPRSWTVKSLGLPKKSQRSEMNSPVPLTSVRCVHHPKRLGAIAETDDGVHFASLSKLAVAVLSRKQIIQGEREAMAECQKSLLALFPIGLSAVCRHPDPAPKSQFAPTCVQRVGVSVA